MKSTATKRTTKSNTEAGVILGNAPSPNSAGRFDAIASAAYFIAQARGFVPGRELDDWLAAEAQLDRQEGR